MLAPMESPLLFKKKCLPSLSEPLRKIFNISLRTGHFSNSWKESFFFPIYKKGNKSQVSNYRGIAALSAVSKLLEKVVLGFITHNCSSYICKTQHGFIAKRSTYTNLLS